MRKVRVFEHTSLDGVISPGRPGEYDDQFVHGGWTGMFRSPAGAQAVVEAQGERFDLLLGRRTYDLWAGYWPTMKGGPFADRLNAATKYVATHRPESLGWGPVQDLGKDAAAGVRELKASEGPDLIAWGSATLVSTLFAEGLVDEVVLFVYPLLLGRGKRFFGESVDPRELALVANQALPSGVMVSRYRVVGGLRR